MHQLTHCNNASSFEGFPAVEETWNLFLQDGTRFEGQSFGAPVEAKGEIVFNTGMVGYPETLTDPSYRGQILVLTFPLIGNYGVGQTHCDDVRSNGLGRYESNRIQVAGLVVSEVSAEYSHWDSVKSLSDWLREERVPALCGIDTRRVTKHLREHGTLLGSLGRDVSVGQMHDPNLENLVSQVSISEPVLYGSGRKRVLLIDCGCKSTIIRQLLDRGMSVLRVPWDYDPLQQSFDGVVISNGPGDPKQCGATISNVRRVMNAGYPILGICLGNQLLALAAGADTFKLKFGHRGHNQPCILNGTKRCIITSQNHGYAVDAATIPEEWEPWFTNANDGTNEGLRHASKPFMSVQFHPEATPGPTDSNYIFDEFIGML
jgi:carbamoyl-phosphate synthase small subunit